MPSPPVDPTRTPGSELVLPANPLMNISDKSLEGYVDCTLYEETGNFFPVDDPENFVDDVIPPPVLAPRPALVRMSGPIEVAVSRVSVPDVPSLPSTGQPGSTIPPPVAAAAATEMPPPSVLGTTPGTTIPPPYAPGTTIPPPYAPGTTTPPPFAATPYPSTTIPPPMSPQDERISRVDLEPRTRKRPPVWMLAGAGVAAAVVLTIIIIVSKGTTSTAAPAADKPAVHNMSAKPAPAKPAAKNEPVPAVGNTASENVEEPPEDEPPHGDGPQVVGSGPCKLVVASTPAGSMVSVDTKTVGPSPITIATECGKHRVDIQHARYQTAAKFVTLEEGKPGSLDVNLARPIHSVSITSQPSGATVFIDGRRAGTTPTVLTVMGFSNLNLEVKKAGYQIAVTKLYSKVPQDKVTIRLAKW